MTGASDCSAATRPVRPVLAPARHEIEQAAARLRKWLAPTPAVSGPGLPDGVALKLETLQPTGSFKIRGALTALDRLGPGDRIVTSSSGNHAQAVAHAASLLGVDATIVVPENIAPVKLAALKRGGAQVMRRGASVDEAEAAAIELSHEEGWSYLSAYNDPDVIAGQGTVALELTAALGSPLTIVCPIGGGGLISGVALWASGLAGVRVVGVESDASTAMSAAIAVGGWCPSRSDPRSPTVSLATSRPAA